METDAAHWLTYRWQKGNRSSVAELRPAHFGAWILKRTWGSMQTHRSHRMTRCVDDYAHARKLLQEGEKRRKARGDTLT